MILYPSILVQTQETLTGQCVGWRREEFFLLSSKPELHSSAFDCGTLVLLWDWLFSVCGLVWLLVSLHI